MCRAGESHAKIKYERETNATPKNPSVREARAGLMCRISCATVNARAAELEVLEGAKAKYRLMKLGCFDRHFICVCTTIPFLQDRLPDR